MGLSNMVRSRSKRARRRRAPPVKQFDLTPLYDLMPSGRTVATAIEEPGGLLSSDTAKLEPARRRDGTLAEGAPEWVPPKRPTVIVIASIHRDPLGQMYARDQVDHARYLAGRYYQELVSIAEIGSIKAFDPGRPVVDGGAPVDPINDRQQAAAKRIRWMNQTLFLSHGHEGLNLIRAVLIDKLPITRIARQSGDNSRQNVDFLRTLFQRCLTRLAIVAGYATASIARDEPTRMATIGASRS
jgi:hypothetical protein